MDRTCGILMGLYEPALWKEEEDRPPCLRPDGHKGDHVLQTKDGRFFAWSFDENYCGDEENCACIHDDGLIECCSWGEIPPTEAERLIKSSLAE